MNKPIVLMDGNNLLWATFHTTDKNETKDDFIKLWRYYILNSILKMKEKFDPKEIVFTLDSNSWRKKEFEYYKARRAIKKSLVDYELFERGSNLITSEIDKVFPYKVLKCDSLEGDDIIAILTEHLQKDNNVVITSRDKDFTQLLKYKNVKVYNPIDDKMIDSDPFLFLIEHIIKGDSIDDIPNILSEDKVFVTGKRQKSITKKVLDEVFELGLQEYVDKYNLHDNYKRNKTMIQLDSDIIPKDLQINLLNQYKSNDPSSKNQFQGVYSYMLSHEIKSLAPLVDKFLF